MTEFGDTGDGITRRDFLDGVAITAAGLAAAAAAPHLTGAEALAASRGHSPSPLPRGYYPPTRTGLKGQSDDVVRDIMGIDGPPNQRDVHSTKGGPGIHVRGVVDSDETYQRNGHSLLGAGAQAVSAGDMWALGAPASRASASTSIRSRASGARRRWACRRAPRTRRRRRGRTATRRCCGCSSTG